MHWACAMVAGLDSPPVPRMRRMAAPRTSTLGQAPTARLSALRPAYFPA
jgi:hypothetical protein